jgi:cytochrome c-type biogenesis protein
MLSDKSFSIEFRYMNEEVTIGIAFATGLASFLSPCVLPLVPVYLTSVCGPEILELKTRKSRISIFFHSLCFVIGFSFVFITVGTIAGLAGFAFGSHLIINKIAGGLLIAFGLFILASLKFPWLNYEKRLNPSLGTTTGYLRSFIIGVVFAFAWAPCIVGLLGGTASLALGSGKAWQGTILLAVYSLALGIPFMIIGVAFDFTVPLLKHIYKYTNMIHIFSGILIIIVGILILTGILG